ncbi:TPA: hypothetical protein ACH3X1_007796 [Trebouxia sp. C0004]
MTAAETIAESLSPGARSLISKLGSKVYSFQHPTQKDNILLPDYIFHSLLGSLGAHIVSVTMLQRRFQKYYFHSALLLELDMATVMRENQAASQWLFKGWTLQKGTGCRC